VTRPTRLGAPLLTGQHRLLAAALLATLAVVVAVAGQRYLDRRPDLWVDGMVMFLLAAGLWLGALRLRPVPAVVGQAALPAVPGPRLDRGRLRLLVVGLGLVALTALVAPLVFGVRGGGFGLLAYPEAVDPGPGGAANATNTFTWLGTWLWLTGLAFYLAAVAAPVEWRRGWRRVVRPGGLRVTVSWAAVAVLAITLLAAYFRFHDLAGVPREMTSDHTEKVLDVADMLAGLRPVYLPRNAGREPLEFYWLTFLAMTGVLANGFMLLKVGMSIISTLTIPVVYLLGKRIGGRELGLLAALAFALSSWHLLITRTGLRIAFSPLFAALTLYCLYRALDSGRRNDFLFLGAALGAGLYGYSGFRPMYFVVPLVIVLKLAHDAWERRRSGAGGPRVPPTVYGHLAAAVGVTLLVATPMIRFALDRPATFWGRTATRMTGAEKALEHPVLQQLVINVRNALLMFNLTADQAWFQNPPGRPALETMGGALLILGLVTAVYLTVRRDWRVGMLLLIIPLMLVSSILALAFPNENPSWSRAAGALPAVMVLAVLPLTVLGELWQSASRRLGVLVYGVALVAVFVPMARNTTERYFVEYRNAYNAASHNTSEGAAVARTYVQMGVPMDHVYLVGWDNGWDYRALGILMGDLHWNGLLWDPSGKDHVALAREQMGDPQPKLYLVAGPETEASANVAQLKSDYPNAVATRHAATIPGKDFWSVYVPGDSMGTGQ
jgi:hypothetical protein